MTQALQRLLIARQRSHPLGGFRSPTLACSGFGQHRAACGRPRPTLWGSGGHRRGIGIVRESAHGRLVHQVAPKRTEFLRDRFPDSGSRCLIALLLWPNYNWPNYKTKALLWLHLFDSMRYPSTRAHHEMQCLFSAAPGWRAYNTIWGDVPRDRPGTLVDQKFPRQNREDRGQTDQRTDGTRSICFFLFKHTPSMAQAAGLRGAIRVRQRLWPLRVSYSPWWA